MSPPIRKKTSRPKAKSGCTTCRIRRIKCDEAEPSCSQCLRGHRLCDGHHLKGGSVSMSAINPTSSANLFATERERRCFEYFRRKTVPQLSGSFELPFWTHLILLAIHHEPAVRQAAIALGALHECFAYPHSNAIEINLNFALQQYVMAIGSVTKPIREQGKLAADVALMTCVLFVCFETLRGYHSTALSHINSGIKIVSELQSHDTSKSSLHLSQTPYVPLPVLNQLFARLDTQVCQVGFGRRRRLLCRNISTEDSGFCSDIPPSFSNLDEARNSLDYIRICADQRLEKLAFSPPNKQPITSSPPMTSFSPDVIRTTKHSMDLIQNVSAIRLRQWSSVFESFLRGKQNLTATEQRAAQILRLHRMVMGVHLSVDFFRVMYDEFVWDEYKNEFEAIVAQAERVLQLSPASMGSSFTLDTEVIMPLAAAAFAYRDGQMRRKLIVLLRSVNRQEGVWNSLLTARVVERVMEIEEYGLDGEVGTTSSIPRCNRVVGIQVELDSEKRAKFQYVKQREDGGMETITEWQEWSGLEVQ
ncbi:hypothetical protein N431DRAFT_391033 [Stipitochalara longipes BDJ]|nr:hypothetical protein N431DRAFT_391033 [Stipitochalara longipes BDJ]